MKALNRFCFLLRLIVIFSAALPAFAKAGHAKGTLRGTVVDQQGETVSVATVTVTNASTGATKTTETRADGSYRVPKLAPGIYEITFTGQGLAKKVSEEIRVSAGQTVFYDAHMKDGGLETVEVSGDEPFFRVVRLLYIDRTKPELSGGPKKDFLTDFGRLWNCD